GGDAKQIMTDKCLVQISDEGAVLEFVQHAIAENPQSVEDHKNVKGMAMGFFVGQIMIVSTGQANPQLAHQLLKQELDKQSVG
ncbi:Asp-tRNA(Asn)/Glu-tRNA(Gln) amidotransferase GatCAB subunit B, partial [Staphylococcus pseudintermedius]